MTKPDNKATQNYIALKALRKISNDLKSIDDDTPVKKLEIINNSIESIQGIIKTINLCIDKDA